MAVYIDTVELLKSIVEHHIAMINRFEQNSIEELSLLFLKIDHIDDIEIKKMIQILFRDSDLIFEYEKNYIILLPKTNWSSAVKILRGLHEFLSQNHKDTIITFPDDGKSTDQLLKKFEKLVKKNYNIELNL